MLNQSRFQTRNSAAIRGTFFRRSLSSLQTLRMQVSQYAAGRRARNELDSLTDYELADIGLTRSAILSAVYGRAE